MPGEPIRHLKHWHACVLTRQQAHELPCVIPPPTVASAMSSVDLHTCLLVIYSVMCLRPAPDCTCWCCVLGLRSLQGREQLRDLVKFVKNTRDNLDWGPGGPPPLLVKIAPDLTQHDKADIAAVVMETAVDGLVVSNTTLSRPGEHIKVLQRRNTN